MAIYLPQKKASKSECVCARTCLRAFHFGARFRLGACKDGDDFFLCTNGGESLSLSVSPIACTREGLGVGWAGLCLMIFHALYKALTQSLSRSLSQSLSHFHACLALCAYRYAPNYAFAALVLLAAILGMYVKLPVGHDHRHTGTRARAHRHNPTASLLSFVGATSRHGRAAPTAFHCLHADMSAELC